jgi:hypothetical protein
LTGWFWSKIFTSGIAIFSPIDSNKFGADWRRPSTKYNDHRCVSDDDFSWPFDEEFSTSEVIDVVFGPLFELFVLLAALFEKETSSCEAMLFPSPNIHQPLKEVVNEFEE